MARFSPVLLLALLPALLLAGCGQVGPLYFDEDPPADQLPPSHKAGAGIAPLPGGGVTAEGETSEEKR